MRWEIVIVFLGGRIVSFSPCCTAGFDETPHIYSVDSVDLALSLFVQVVGKPCRQKMIALEETRKDRSSI